MKKSSWTCIITTLILLIPSIAIASLQYLDNDANYPVSYYHANYREYVDLSSCTYREEDDYNIYATGYIAYTIGADNDNRTYRIRQFRQSKSGVDSPQFYDEASKKWITIPPYEYNDIKQYMSKHGYMGYIDRYYPYEYYMFKIVYNEIHGVFYPDNLEGNTP